MQAHVYILYILFSLVYNHIYTESIATMARATLCSYRKVHTEGAWKEMASANFVPRIVELIQSLPSLASRGHESELRARCYLISGYLQVTLDETIGSASSKEGETGYQMSIASALACEGVSSVIRRALAELCTEPIRIIIVNGPGSRTLTSSRNDDSADFDETSALLPSLPSE